MAFYRELYSMEILRVDKFCLGKKCTMGITHFHIDYDWDSWKRLLFAKDKEVLWLVTFSMESTTKENAKCVHCSIPISLTVCYVNIFSVRFPSEIQLQSFCCITILGVVHLHALLTLDSFFLSFLSGSLLFLRPSVL